MHLLSETILENYYGGDDGRNNNNSLIRKKKRQRDQEGWNRKGKGDKNHKSIWFLSCFRHQQQQQPLTDCYSAESVKGGGGGGGGGGDYLYSLKVLLEMEDDYQKDGYYLPSSYPPSTTESTTATTTTASTTMPSPDGSRGKPKKGLKRFPRVLKAILFETSLAKKIRKRKNTQKGGGNIYVTTNGNVDPTALGSEQEPITSTETGSVHLVPSTASLTTGGVAGSMSSTCTTALTNSTFASSNNSSTNSRSSTGGPAALPPLAADAAAGEIILLQQQEPLQADGKSPTAAAAAAGMGKYSSNVGLCLILVSLVVLVFWGKICAIIFTSTWLFFVPHCIPGTAGMSLSRIGAYYRKIEPEEYKKKVVMEGFLERNIRNRARRWVGGLKGRGSRNINDE